MQAIIPVAGAGTQLRPHTYTQPKALMAVAGKPVLSYIIDQLIEADVKRFVFVIGYLGDKIKEFVLANYPNIDSSFVEQESREGLGHAIYLAKDLIDKTQPIIIQLGDTILDADIKKIIGGPNSTLCVKKVADPREFGVAEIGEENTITHLIEKPLIPRSNMALVGFYFIKESQKLFDALYQNMAEEKRVNNEFYLTNGLQRMLNEGVVFKSYKIEHWFDVGKKDILLQTNEILLKRNATNNKTQYKGTNSIVIAPCYIDPTVTLNNAVIGPFTTIGANTVINNSVIKNSIIGNFSKLENVVLSKSLIGSDSMISGLSQSLNIGDNTELDLRGEK